MSYMIFMFTAAIIIGIVSGIFGLSTHLMIIVLFILAFMSLGYILYTIQFSKNMDRIHKFLEKNQKQPVYRYAFEVGNGSTESQLEAIDAILKKYKSPVMQATYKMHRALLSKNYILAMQEIQTIANKPLGQYCIATLYALQGDHQQARQIPLKPAWQQAVVEAIIAFNEQSPHYEEKKQQAIDLARGVQRYVNVHFFKDLEK